MKVPFVDLSRQYAPLMDRILDAMKDVIDRCAFINGPEVKEFEERMGAWLGQQVCAVSNCTHAIELTLKALGIGPGDEVITVPNTAFPTCEAIHATGARVVFADIAPGSYNMDPEAAEQAVTEKTKALVPVHLYGIPADMEAIITVARRHGLYVVEDCAQAQGARYRGRRVGTLGIAGCFSFFPSKNLGAFGDGGAMCSGDPDLVRRVRMMANHGREEKFTHVMVGTNSRLDTLKAAQLSICLDALDEWNRKRREAARLYSELLRDYDEIIPPRVPDQCEAVWHLYVIRHERRDALRAFLKEQGIATGLHYPSPLHLQPVYADAGWGEGSLPRAEAACREILSLPMFPGITREEVEAVCRAIGRFLEKG
ncbi:MAG: DegT/DnrJ/EryC1/StrS family aminotransferase [Deltaproteobacteria bacterium]|nr:DegT/DnrJ/EryC1/StrS family aminotransferase [Deltaproteobacteria bacterium]MBW1948826.1 DegT/DnrJ/EryC1/StrS family aminotransferase [Deltaproteobacteria bacterium]